MMATAAPVTHCRWMIGKDMEQVLDIERRCYVNGWVLNDFRTILRCSCCVGIVAEQKTNCRILGYMLYELKKRSFFLLNMAVHPNYHRRGVGTELLDLLKSKLNSNQRNRIELLVRDTNLPAQLFFRAQGFRAIGVLRGYYEDNEDDAYQMEYLYA